MSEEKKNDANEEFINPIDEDSITNSPDTPTYGHHIGSLPIKPTEQSQLKSKAFSFFMKIIILVSIAILIPFFAISQLSKEQQLIVDSLKLIVQLTTDDSIKVKAIGDWDNYIYRFDPKLDLKLNQQTDSICSENLSKYISKQRKIFFQKSQGFSLNAIGSYYYAYGDYPKSLKAYQRSLKIREALQLDREIAATLVNLGLLHKNLGNYDVSLDMLLRAKEIGEKIENNYILGATLNNIANVYRDQGYVGKAIQYASKGLKLKEGADPRDLISSYANLASLYTEQGNYNKALKMHEKCLEISLNYDDKMGKALAWFGMGGAYQRKNEYDKGLKYHLKSLELRQELGDKPGIAHSLTFISFGYKLIGDYKAALEYAQKAYEIDKEIGDTLEMNNEMGLIADIYVQMNQFNRAIEITKETIAAGKKIGQSNSIKFSSNRLLTCYWSIDSINKAMSYLDELNQIQRKEFKVNMPIFSERDREIYFEKILPEFHQQYDFIRANHSTHDSLVDIAFNNALLTKGLLLRSSTATRNTILNSGDSVLIDKYKSWIELKKKIAKMVSQGEKIENIERDTELLENELVKLSVEFSDQNSVYSIKWKDVQKELKENEAAIEFIQYKTYEMPKSHLNDKLEPTRIRLTALIVTHDCDHPKFIELCDNSQVAEILGDFPGNNIHYIKKIYGTKEKLNDSLYQLLWKPMENSLKGIKKVYYSPTGLLHKISFSSLGVNQKVLLSENIKLERKSSCSKLIDKENFNMNKSYVTTLFGGIDYDSDSSYIKIWTYLNGTNEEASEIEKSFLKKHRKVHYFSHNLATEEQFKKSASESHILHIATHGFFYHDPSLTAMDNVAESVKDISFRGSNSSLGIESFVKNINPLMRSGLVFANANDVWNQTDISGEDGVLTAAEVAMIDMQQTELVTLSACETGLGDIKGSEGVYGLQRSFKMAGVKYLIMSLWQVPDKETSEFMTTFYRYLLKINDIKKAFNLTQKEMREKYDPYFWAAFVLVE